jgi:hypothetical protein
VGASLAGTLRSARYPTAGPSPDPVGADNPVMSTDLVFPVTRDMDAENAVTATDLGLCVE